MTGPNGIVSRRKNATRETTAMLKDWLDEHGANPYPTKGEKIMLTIITKMSLTQVSTWFANARRRMKKENRAQAWTAFNGMRAGPPVGPAPGPAKEAPAPAPAQAAGVASSSVLMQLIRSQQCASLSSAAEPAEQEASSSSREPTAGATRECSPISTSNTSAVISTSTSNSTGPGTGGKSAEESDD